MGKNKKKGMTYKEAGVDIEAAEKSIELAKSVIETTYTPEVLSGVGGFAGIIDLTDI
jgi:phosphoribosylformylglycinamidine cyclo-ligase